MLGGILKYGTKYDIRYFDTPEEPEVEYVFVNTCGFLSTSRIEAENTLLKLDSLGKKIILLWCYIPVRDDVFLDSLNHLVAIVPFERYGAFIDWFADFFRDNHYLDTFKSIPPKISAKHKADFAWDHSDDHVFLHTHLGYEYLKIAEGCSNHCTYCLIPLIRGSQRSRSISDILGELRLILATGAREVEIIAQDTGAYGSDFAETTSLIDLLCAIDAEPGDFQFRLYYLYPEHINDAFLRALKKLKKFIPYFDIPFQHASAPILKRMGRLFDTVRVDAILDSIRSIFPESWIHTNFIIGFPGEGEKDIKQLLDFIDRHHFESASLFGYHDESLAPSSKLWWKVPDRLILARLKRVQKQLDNLWNIQHKACVGSLVTGTIMEKVDTGTYRIRRDIQAPEVDAYDNVSRKQLLLKAKKAIGPW
jgi:ribosomal protein S12 methylthiotransferase